MTLRDIAHSRTGDKGTTVNISLIVYDLRDYARVSRVVTVERVKAELGGLAHGPVRRYDLPQLGALNFVFDRPPGDSVTRTLALDAHGKSLSSALLAMELRD